VLSFVKGIRQTPDDTVERRPLFPWMARHEIKPRRRFQWMSLRLVALAGSFLWFYAWWNHFGRSNAHDSLALAWLALIYFGFLAEVFMTLQIALPRLSPAQTPESDLSPSRIFTQPIGPPGADSSLAIFSLLNTA